ncbi:multidrug DMT transporter permease [Olivibacter sp. SDN3]|uniref:GRP family sugar transporter n=1 Tax=Olivibacter sp. SDN3 TaxID=2764720 RepID=UPI00165186CB|nr:GRP family sugar transporter [Olivibacter sp. SDN3]QNL49039.1 multidrug DMT transporter permease [Olivibacter sp. SDN3]
MFVVQDYTLAVTFCIITMLCWGSWANTQKLVQKEWRFELFYWDYVLGIFLLAVLGAFTMGSIGASGRSFLDDLGQAEGRYIQSAFTGGVVFNLANILLTAAIAGAGMAVAFPVGIGLALVIGVLINYFLLSKGNPVLLFLGVGLITLAIVFNAIAFRQQSGNSSNKAASKWIVVSVVAGILMSTFYPFIAASMDLTDFVSPTVGKMTPYTAFAMFAVGILVSNLLFNTLLMRRPLEGPPITYSEYFSGRKNIHLVGILGGCIWGIGNLFNLIAAGKAGPAISYGLGQGATLVAALWGVVIWKEFRRASKIVNALIIIMFILFVSGLVLVIIAGNENN